VTLDETTLEPTEVAVTTPVLSAEPIDELRCTFVADRPFLLEEGPRKFTTLEEATEAPLAEAVLAIDGVCEAVFSGDRVTVVREAGGPAWDDLIPRIQYALGAAVTSAATAIDTDRAPALDDDSIYDEVAHIFKSQINPIVAEHGGAIDLIDVQDATVVVRMSGGCQGCGMANVTLRQGIEAALKKAIPALAGIRDVTDHSSGANPYFASTSK
jgi:Fe-S cluster biogenesis protein NfuA